MSMESLTRDDLRAAVGAGVITEAQGAQLLALGEVRLGQRAAMAADDEPFELFRGFAEIFVSVGIILLFAGTLTMASVAGGAILPAVTAGLAWVFALYFTRKRRMALPSIVIAIAFTGGVTGMLALLMGDLMERDQEGKAWVFVYLLLTAFAVALYFRAFRVPFVALILGLLAMGMVFLAVDAIIPFGEFPGSFREAFDLRHGSGLPIASLAFGLLALGAGLWCDMKDPHRLGRWSATGFWLHILAAPALVNTLALTAYNTGAVAGNILLAVALAVVTVLALVIDRRSFLTAGIGYLGVLLAWAIGAGDSVASFAGLLIALGAFLTFMGAKWTELRARLMRTLPDFRGKDRLPPYAKA